MEVSKGSLVLLFLISFLSLCFSIFALCSIYELNKSDVQYVVYLGTNSNKTYRPIFSPEESKAKADEILFKYFGGFTLQEAKGGWKNDDGSLDHEYTLVIYLSDTTLEKVHKASDELIKVFEQSSVLIQTNRTKTEFYSGTK